MTRVARSKFNFEALSTNVHYRNYVKKCNFLTLDLCLVKTTINRINIKFRYDSQKLNPFGMINIASSQGV